MEPVLVSFHAPVHELDVVAQHVVRDGIPARLREWQRRTGARELVYLATCQRVLWMIWGGDAAALDPGPGARRYEGEDAWVHLLAMAAGLESANLGDREIPGQMKDSLQQAREVGVAAEEAHAAFEDVIREGQRLRTRLGLADGNVSVATVALKHLCEGLSVGSSVALVGVGPMTQYLAQRLPERGFRVAVANRTRGKAHDLADPLGLAVVDLARLQRDPEGFDAIVSATAAPEPIFTLDAWATLKRPPLRILDLALPPDSEPGLEQLPWVHRVDLTAFLAQTATARAQRAEAASKAEAFLVGAAGRLRHRAAARAHKRRLATSQERLDTAWGALENEVKALEDSMHGLDEAQREALREILTRGRTLAFRALIQTRPKPDPNGEAAIP
ncbi:NAD(P)-binding domain-containing protein [Geothrix sp. 21YS21S-4]|uniref:NAD(P)-binding domain-containing protein n=1 Tax=Geothrix sp. 21YS21S-4 TaxID=3068889 RepID=UPI0027BAF28D|nr:NAD(P)-binding domain-containing protein [Geothrix sp. 21YS21S-4]